jgi:hypothetical protein
MPTIEADSNPATNPPADPNAAAVLVIHGIGEQAPYQTLDAFVQGVAVKFGIQAKQLEHRLESTRIGTLSSIRMPLPRATARGGARVLDFYEFHWAGMVEGRIGLRQVLGWLLRTALSPLRLWAHQAIALTQAARAKGERRPNLTPYFLGEIGRSALLLVVGAALVAPFVYSLSQPRALAAAWGALRLAVPSVRDGLVLAMLIAGALLVFATARGGGALLRQWRKGAGTERWAVEWWSRASIGAAAIIVALAIAADFVLHLQSGRLLRSIWNAVAPLPISLPLLAAVAGAGLGRLLVDYLGDVALYTAADENSVYFRTRVAILKKSTELLRHLCEGGGYGGVYLAGHSLGSVIAYDSINKYVKDTRAGAAPKGEGVGMERLRGLLTFGSPLDAVYYFFRTDVGPHEPVRAQILSSLHGFRKRSSGRDYGRFTLAEYEVPELKRCHWLNVYSHTDLISRRLVFYDVDEQVSRAYPLSPIRAHLAYWNDPEFYALVSRWL